MALRRVLRFRPYQVIVREASDYIGNFARQGQGLTAVWLCSSLSIVRGGPSLLACSPIRHTIRTANPRSMMQPGSATSVTHWGAALPEAGCRKIFAANRTVIAR